MSGKINWIASYPKSGNTWVRAFLTSLICDVPEEQQAPLINRLLGRWCTSRELMRDVLGSDSNNFTAAELNRLRPVIYRALSQSSHDRIWLKTHEVLAPYYPDCRKGPIPALNPSVTQSIIYLVRHPFDVAISYANHLNCDIETSVRHLLNTGHSQQYTLHGFREQFPEHIGSWSENVHSWVVSIERLTKIPAIWLRYEDMLREPEKTFTRLVQTLDLDVTDRQVRRAIQQTQISELKKMENDHGFRERTRSTGMFFRKGASGEGVNLSSPQKSTMHEAFQQTMEPLGYTVDQVL